MIMTPPAPGGGVGADGSPFWRRRKAGRAASERDDARAHTPTKPGLGSVGWALSEEKAARHGGKGCVCVLWWRSFVAGHGNGFGDGGAGAAKRAGLRPSRSVRTNTAAVHVSLSERNRIMLLMQLSLNLASSGSAGPKNPASSLAPCGCLAALHVLGSWRRVDCAGVWGQQRRRCFALARTSAAPPPLPPTHSHN